MISSTTPLNIFKALHHSQDQNISKSLKIAVMSLGSVVSVHKVPSCSVALPLTSYDPLSMSPAALYFNTEVKRLE